MGAVQAARVRTIDHCVLPARDRRRATTFYGRVLRGRWDHEHDTGTFFWFGRSEVAVFIDREREIPPPSGLLGVPRVAFEVAQEDFPDIVSELSRLPVPFDGPVQHVDGRVLASVYFVDGEGNYLEACHRGQRKVSADRWEWLGLDHVEFETLDLQRAVRFYTETLGGDLMLQGEDERQRPYARVAVSSGQYFGLHQVPELSPRTRTRYQGTHTAVFTTYDEYDSIVDCIGQCGGELEGDVREAKRPAGEKSTYFLDPDGNRLQMTAPAPLQLR